MRLLWWCRESQRFMGRHWEWTSVNTAFGHFILLATGGELLVVSNPGDTRSFNSKHFTNSHRFRSTLSESSWSVSWFGPSVKEILGRNSPHPVEGEPGHNHGYQKDVPGPCGCIRRWCPVMCQTPPSRMRMIGLLPLIEANFAEAAQPGSSRDLVECRAFMPLIYVLTREANRCCIQSSSKVQIEVCIEGRTFFPLWDVKDQQK